MPFDLRDLLYPGLGLGLVLAAIAAIAVALNGRNRKKSAFGKPAYRAAFTSAAQELRLQLAPDDLRFGARRQIWHRVRKHLLVLAAFAGLFLGFSVTGLIPAGPRVLAVATGFFLSLAGVVVASGCWTLHGLMRWPMDQSIAFVSPSVGPVVMTAERIFAGGQISRCRDLHFSRDRARRGVLVLHYDGTGRGTAARRELLLFDWPQELPKRARATIESLLVEASAPELPIGRKVPLEPASPE